MEGGSSRRLVHERHHLLHDLQGVHGPGAAARLIVVPMPNFFLDIMFTLSAQRIASHSPMSMAPMLKSPSRTGLHVAMRVRKGVGIGGLAAPIKLSIP